MATVTKKPSMTRAAKRVEAIARQYPGGAEKLLLAVDDPDFPAAFYTFCDARLAAREAALARPPSALEFLGTVPLPELPEFNPADHFRTDDAAPNGVKIGSMDGNFRRLLATVEPARDASELRRHRLTERMSDPQILASLGERAITSLGRIWQLLERQPNGGAGDLLTNVYAANIFEILDDDGNSWSAFCYWFVICGYWRLHAFPAAGPDDWSAGSQVFSC